MPKISKSTLAIPSIKFRRMIWARKIRGAIAKSEPADQPLAHLIDTQVKNAVAKLPSTRKSFALEKLDPNGKSIVSQSAWHGWWSGTRHPTPDKIAFFEILAPGSKDWLTQRLPIYKSESFKTFMCALDTWASQEEKRLKAISIIEWQVVKWAPKCKTSPIPHPNKPQTWEIPTLSKEVGLQALRSFKPLEPSSIVELLISNDIVSMLNITDRKLEWTLDLLSCALAIRALFDGSHFLQIKMAGATGLIMTSIMEIFIWQPKIYVTTKVIGSGIANCVYEANARAINSRLSTIHKFGRLGLNDEALMQIVVDGFNQYLDLIRNHGIAIDDFASLYDPDWFYAELVKDREIMHELWV